MHSGHRHYFLIPVSLKNNSGSNIVLTDLLVEVDVVDVTDFGESFELE